jgi:hypothetical protein
LGGDSRKVPGQTTFPSLCKQPGVARRTGLIPKFATKTVPACPWEAVVAALCANPKSALVAPAVAPGDKQAAPVIHAQLALPLPPQLAALFLLAPVVWRTCEITNTFWHHHFERNAPNEPTETMAWGSSAVESEKDVVLHVYQLNAGDSVSEVTNNGNGRASGPGGSASSNNGGGGGTGAFSVASWFAGRVLPAVGFGAHHTAVEVDGYRYTFAANAGIVKTVSRLQGVPSNAVFKESVALGSTALSRGEISAVAKRLGETFGPNSYHLVHRNCNHFTETFATALLLDWEDGDGSNSKKRLDSYPVWINRLAYAGAKVVPHDDDITPCHVWEEARKAAGVDNKVGWNLSSKPDDSSSSQKKRSSAGASSSKKAGSQKKKELTEAQKAALAKIRSKK